MKLSNVGKNILAIFSGLVLLLLVEAILAIGGAPSLVNEDPFVGFSGSSPVFIADNENRYITNPAKLKYFNEQSFQMPKADNVFRIIAFGGSTTYGRPYLMQTAFPAWVKKLLERYAPGKKYEVINVGGISYASYRVRRLMTEMAGYQPDLFIVYSGHNEFLEQRTFADIKEQSPIVQRMRDIAHHSRIYSLLATSIRRIQEQPSSSNLGEDVTATLEQIGGPELYQRDPEFRDGVIRQYRTMIEEMAELSRKKNIPLILCTLPVNLSGLSPFKSELRSSLSPDQILAWNDAFNKGEAARQNSAYETALKAYLNAARIDDGSALLHYRMGQVLESLQRYDDAYIAYDQARQEDIVPLRALNEFNSVVRDVAGESGVPLADIERIFRRVSPNGIPGWNLFADHVHPTIEGQQLAAWVILNTATENSMVPLTNERWQQNMNNARAFLRSELNDIPAPYQARGVWGVGRLYFWAGKYPEAYRALQLAWTQVKDDAEIPYQLGQLEIYRGAAQKSLDYLKEALKLDPDDEKIEMAMVEAYLLDGQAERALEVLNHLSAGLLSSTAGKSLKGRVLAKVGQVEEAILLLEEAARQAPDIAKLHYDLAQALVENNQLEAALTEYRRSLELSKHPDVEGALERWAKQVRPQRDAQ